ncbi:chemotaxis protein CheW [Comamonas flocculans]|uniref:Chemotaxis protein CheW n=1 Tax=Comamonas flocculans TaxID=2597701 RepID=A0A5B8RUE8_9BURK|nr:chemotaxis protein CheW [Comamonas flocculans]QEA12362.1 chemotaxis protein CheW [Comamonas flocculans]
MAERETLKDVQLRLLARLQAASAENVAVASWLAVECADLRLLLPLTQAGEIFSWSGTQPVPHARPWFLGVANLRGVLAGVIDLAMLLGAPVQARSEQALSECALVTMGAALEVNAALLIDRFAGLRGAQDFVATQPPAPDALPCMRAVQINARDEHWQILDLQTLAQDAAFLNIGA